MKRIICFLLCLILPAAAFALPDIDIMIEGHNANRLICNASEIKNPEIKDDSYTFKATENVHVIFRIKNDMVNTCSCVCLNEADAVEFFAQCITICYNFGGIEAGNECYDSILYSFMQARAGRETDKVVLPGIMFHLYKESFGYVFVLAKVK